MANVTIANPMAVNGVATTDVDKLALHLWSSLVKL